MIEFNPEGSFLMKKYFLLLIWLLLLSCSPSPKFSKGSLDIPAAGYIECTKGIEKLLPIEEEVIDEINVVRTNPKYYIQLLEERKKRFTGKILILQRDFEISYTYFNY